MKKSTIIILILIFLAVSGGAFYGGMKYGQNKSQNDRQQRFQQFGQFPGGPGGMGMRDGRNGQNRQGMEFTIGEILFKDDTSVTVKLRDGGSKIIFLSQSTQIMKTSAGAPQDLVIGEQVSVNGNTNADGSLTAAMIQVRPPIPAEPTPLPWNYCIVLSRKPRSEILYLLLFRNNVFLLQIGVLKLGFFV